MSDRNNDLHGNAPDKCHVAVLAIDVINDLEFEGGEQLLPQAEAMATRLRTLMDDARTNRVPVIYVNDNFGRWRSDLRAIVDRCLSDSVRGSEIVRKLQPTEIDYFVVKPKHSGFFSTGLETLLKYLGVQRLIITGLATNICVLFTANDAYMRDFEIHVPEDCSAAMTNEIHQFSLEQIREILKADTSPSEQIDFEELKRTN